MEEHKSQIFKEFFDYFKSSGSKAVAVISDMQVIFRISNYRNADIFGSDHMSMSTNATKDMGVPSHNYFSGCNNLNVYIFFQNGHAQICLPSRIDNNISIAQYQFLMEILDAFEQAQNIIEKETNHDMEMYTDKDVFKDINSIREELKSRIIKQVYTRKENIIGFTHTKEDIKKQMEYNLDIGNIKTKNDLRKKLNDSFYTYYTDTFYHDIFLEAFPNYELLHTIINTSNVLNEIDEKIFENTLNYHQISRNNYKSSL